MDLKSLETDVSARRCFLLHPKTGEMLNVGDDKKRHMWISVKSTQSLEYRKAMFSNRRAMAAKVRDEMAGGEDLKDLQAEDLFAQGETLSRQALIDICEDWCVYWNGEEPEFSKEKLEEFFDSLPFFQTQVQDFCEDFENFTTG